MAYGYYASITVDNTKVSGSSNFTDFPVLVSSTYDGTGGEPDFRTTANGGNIQNTDASGGADGSTTVPADLAFYDDADQTTQYDHEIVRYNASTGEFVAYVRIPTLTYDSDTVFYVFYGDSSVTASQENIDGTWASAYKGVWHMEGSSVDSSGNSQDGSDTDISYATGSGKIGQGAESPGGAGDSINFGNNAIFDWTSENFTIALWVYMTSTTNGEILLTRGDYNNDGYYVAYRYSAPNWGLQFYTSQSSAFQRTETTMSKDLNTWYRVVVNRTGNDVDIWFNGTEATYLENGNHTDPTTNSRNLYLFAYDGAILPIPGYMDEVMMVEELWGDDRIITDYNSQGSPSTFYAMGSETSVNTAPNTPSITSPTASQTDVAVNPTVTSSAFSDNDAGEVHQSSQWQVATDSGFSNLVWDSGTDTTNLVSVTVNATDGTFEGALAGETALANNTTYYVRVKHTDDEPADSSYSTGVEFTTTVGGSGSSSAGGHFHLSLA